MTSLSLRWMLLFVCGVCLFSDRADAQEMAPAPSISITSPADDAFVFGVVPIVSTASKNVLSVQFQVDGVNLGTATSTAPFSANWDTTKVLLGTHTLSAVATSDAGIQASSSVLVIVDNTAPYLAIDSPLAAEIVFGTAAFSVTAADNKGVAWVKFLVDGSAFQTPVSTPPYRVVWDSSKILRGTHTLTAVASNVAGLQTSSSVVVMVDNTPPRIALDYPQPNEIVFGTMTFAATADDNKGIAWVRFLVDGSSFQAAVSTPPYEVVWDSRKVARGTHTITTVASNIAGLQASSTTVVTVENGAPPSVSITSPSDDAIVFGVVPIVSTVSKNVLSVQFQVDGVNLGAAASTAPFSVNWDTTKVLLGTHTLSAVATSDAGIQASSSVLVTVDNTAPEITIESPSPDEIVFSTVEFSVTPTDNKGVAWVNFLVDGSSFQAVASTPPYRAVWDSSKIASGTHTLTAVASNIAGVQTSSSVVVMVDNTAPEIALDYPQPNEIVVGTMTFAATADDNKGIAWVKFLVDGSSFQAAVSTPPYQVVWDSRKVARGTHTITAVASNIAGLQASSSTVVTVENSAPQVFFNSPAAENVVSGAVTILATAGDAVGIAHVRFQADGKDLGPAIVTPPYSTSWDTTKVSAGTHTLTAVATNIAGVQSASSINLTVGNTDNPSPPGSVVGSTYFTAVDGNDSYPGTKAQPWQHPEYAVTKLAFGDVLYLRGGVYASTNPIVVNNSGAANARIAIRSYPGELAVIDAAAVVGVPDVEMDGKPRPNQDGITINGDYIDVDGLEVKNAWTRGIRVSAGHHIRLTNNVVHDNHDGGLVVAYPYGGHAASDVLIEGNISHHNAKDNSPTVEGGMWSAGVAILNTKDVTIRNNKVYDNYGEGIACYVVDHCDMTGNVAYDNFAVNLYYDNVTNSVMSENFVYTEDNKEFYRVGTTPNGIALANENYRSIHKNAFNLLDHDMIVNNVVVGGQWAVYFSTYQGVLVDKTPPPNGITNSTIAFNTFFGGTDSVLWIEEYPGNKNNEVANNVFYQPYPGKPLADHVQSPEFNFHNNLWFASGGGTPGDAQGPNDVLADPLFANASKLSKAASDFKLKPASPAIGAAVSMAAVATDFWGATRPAKAKNSIGAHEWGGAIPPASPAVSITAPKGGSTLSGQTTITASASDALGISFVQFKLDGGSLGAAISTPPYSMTWDTTKVFAGTHTLTALARNVAGLQAAASVNVTVKNTSKPTVSITAPKDGALLSGTTTITAAAIDAIGISSVQFTLDGGNLGTAISTPPYSLAWDTTKASKGAHTLTVVAVSIAGGQTSASINVTVDNAPQPPPQPAPDENLPYPQGKRFPLGLYSIDTVQQMKQEGAFGWNIAHVYTSTQEYVTQASHQALVKQAGGWFGLAHLDPGTEEATGAAISELSLKGPVAWWDLPEEMRHWEPEEFAVFKNMSAWARKHDPAKHPAFMYIPDNYDAADISLYVPYLDIIGAGAYPEYMHQPRAFVRWRVESEIEAIHLAAAKVGPDYLHGEKTPIGITELFAYEKNMSAITPEAAYHDFYSCLAAGAKGILTYAYFHRNDAPGLQKSYEAYAKAAAEVSGQEGLGQALLFGKETPLSVQITTGPLETPSFKPEGSTVTFHYSSLNVLAQQYQGKLFIVAVNSSEQPIKAKIAGLPGAAASLQLPFEKAIGLDGKPAAEHRTLLVKDGGFEDSFSGLGVHVYIITAAAPPTVSITAPKDGATVSGALAITAQAGGAASVQFQLDGVNFGAAISTPPYSVAWDTTKVSAGTHTLTAVAVNLAGLQAAAPVNVTVNNASKPTVSITAPKDGALLSGTTTITAAAIDAIGISSVQFTLDGGNLGAAISTPPYALAWDTMKVSAGTHTLTAVAVNLAGLQATAAVNVTVNNPSKPTVSITTPKDGALLSGTTTITAAASDMIGISSLQFTLDGGNLGAAISTPPYALAWDTTKASAGAHTLTVVAFNAVGLKATASVSVTVNNAPVGNVPPTGSGEKLLLLHDIFKGPAGGPTPSFLQKNKAYLETLPFDGVSISLGDAGGTIDLSGNIMGPPISYATFTAVLAPVKDLNFKNLKHNFAFLILKDDPPDFFDDWTTVINNFANLAHAAKDNGLEGILFDNEDYGGDNGPFWATYPKYRKYPAKSLKDYQDQARLRGQQVMKAMVAEFPDIVFLGLMGPYVSEKQQPAEWGYIDGFDQLNGPFFVGFMEGMGPQSTVVDGGELYMLATPNDFQKAHTWRKQTIASKELNCPYIPSALRPVWGQHLSIGYGVYDMDGTAVRKPAVVGPIIANALHQTDRYVWFYPEGITFLNSPKDGGASEEWRQAITLSRQDKKVPGPAVSIAAPKDGAAVSGTVVLTATATDANGLSFVQFKLDGAALGVGISTPPYSTTWDTTKVSAGTHTLTAVAVNIAGLQAIASVNVTVNNASKPTVSITAPKDGALLSGTTTITASAFDTIGISSLQFTLDGGNLGAAISTPPYALAWDTTKVSAGTHTLTAVAVNLAGLKATTSVNVTVNNVSKPTTVSITTPDNGATVFGVVPIAAVASDAKGIASVQFQIDGTSLGSPLAAFPYTVSWDTTKVVGGTHAVTAVAYDLAGIPATSSVVIVRVYNPPLQAGNSDATEFSLVWHPSDPALAVASLKTSDPSFPASQTLTAIIKMPSGMKTLAMIRLSVAPLVYHSAVPVTSFSDKDFFQLENATTTVSVGTQTFVARGRGTSIYPALGGTIREASGAAQVIIKPGALTHAANIKIRPEPQDPVNGRGRALTRQNLKPLGSGREIMMASSGTFSAATLVLPFDPAAIPAGGRLSEATIAYFNPATEAWEPVSNTSVVGNTLVAQVGHFSLYAPVFLMPNSAAGLRDSYVFPNPSVAPDEPVIRAFVGVVASVEVSIFDVSGQWVHSGSINGAPTGIMNGNYYYDYKWSGSKASGVYFAVIHGRAPDGSVIRARAAFAIVR